MEGSETDSVGDLVVGTAGHIDHGKSALVRALTGIDPDRLPEEKSRGMTIDLGFAAMIDPSGRRTSFVDVPGHERFVANMVAGVTGIDAVLLVIAADEGVMPQTREHLAILDLLNVSSGVIAITKADLTDASLLQLVLDEARELVGGTPLEGVPIIPVSSVTGIGVDVIRETLSRIVMPPSKREDGVPRLPIDRVFTLAGFGTVVTGTLLGGTFAIGDQISALPARLRGRIRGIQTHGQSHTHARRGSRTALNLSGIGRHELQRGDVIALPETLPVTRRFDAYAKVLGGSPVDITRNVRLTVHCGTSEVAANIFPLETMAMAPGDQGWVQVRLDGPIAAWRGQRVILRLPSPVVTVGGCVIADVAPRRRARDENPERLSRLLSDDPEVLVESTLRTRRLDLSTLSRLTTLKPAEVERVVAVLQQKGRIARLGRHYVSAGQLMVLQEKALAVLGVYHHSFPLRTFMPKEQLRGAMKLNPAEFADLLDGMRATGSVRESRPDAAPVEAVSYSDGKAMGIKLANHEVRIDEASGSPSSESLAVAQFLEALGSAHFQPPPVGDLLIDCKLSVEVLNHLVETGQVVRIDESIFITREACEVLVRTVCQLLVDEKTFTIARLRDALGASRKYALAFAGYLDSRHLTRRVGDERVEGRNFDARRA